MSKHAAPCAFATLAVLAAAGPSVHADECPKAAGSEVVVEALRFSDGRSYVYRVTNNGTSPISTLSIGTVGAGADTFIEDTYGTDPVSIGSPKGWEGSYVLVQDPRQPQAHATTQAKYFWIAEDSDARIQPGRSLSGFSVQLPTPREAELAYMQWSGDTEPMKDPSFEERLPPQPDLTGVHFLLGSYATCALLGTVELDRGWEAAAPDS